MLEQAMVKGVKDACAKFGIKLAAGAPAGLLGGVKNFLGGQGAAAKGLVQNLRGGLGGKLNPAIAGPNNEAAEFFGNDLMKSMHRTHAMDNLKTLAPTLAAGGGLALLHHHNANKREEQQRQQMAMQQQPMPQGY